MDSGMGLGGAISVNYCQFEGPDYFELFQNREWGGWNGAPLDTEELDELKYKLKSKNKIDDDVRTRSDKYK